MIRRIGIMVLTLSVLAVVTPRPAAHAQWRTAFRQSGIHYSGYGQGYYNGNGQGYTVYSPGAYTYSGYGNGPYLYGAQSANTIPNRAY